MKRGLVHHTCFRLPAMSLFYPVQGARRDAQLAALRHQLRPERAPAWLPVLAGRGPEWQPLRVRRRRRHARDRPRGAGSLLLQPRSVRARRSPPAGDPRGDGAYCESWGNVCGPWHNRAAPCSFTTSTTPAMRPGVGSSRSFLQVFSNTTPARCVSRVRRLWLFCSEVLPGLAGCSGTQNFPMVHCHPAAQMTCRLSRVCLACLLR